MDLRICPPMEHITLYAYALASALTCFLSGNPHGCASSG